MTDVFNKIAFLLIIVLFVSCNQKADTEYTNKEGHSVKDEFYGNGKVKSRTIFLNQDQSDFIYVAYYDNGEIMDSASYSNNKVEGLRKYFDQSVRLLHLENYKNGFLNGPHKAIYDNGVSSFDGYRLKGAMVGEWNFHYPEGGPITYEFYDSVGTLKYFRKYNEDRSLFNKRGEGIINIGSLPDSIVAGAVYHLSVISACPPGCESVLKVNTTGKNENPVVFYNGAISETRNIIPFSFVKPGNFDINVLLTIKDAKSHDQESYSSTVSVQIN